MVYAIKIDWQEEWKIPDKWDNVGRRLLEDNCKHKDQDNGKETNMRYAGYCEKCEVGEDTSTPMMNFGFPLETTPENEKVLEVVKRTNCTVMCNTETDEFFLVLCGGGMDLSQDIALSYHILERWIPYDLAVSVCTQKDLSLHGKDWEVLKKAMQESLQHYVTSAQGYLLRWG